MKDILYNQLKKNWRYLHPISKLFTNVDYVIERVGEKVQKLTTHYFKTLVDSYKRIEVKKL